MKIAFTHNLKIADTEEEAEFDTPDTVAVLADAMRALGTRSIASRSRVSRLVARLERVLVDATMPSGRARRASVARDSAGAVSSDRGAFLQI